MQITAIEKDKRRMKTINKAAISITVIAAMTMCMSFAYAGIFESIGDALFVGTALTNPTDIIIGGVIMLVFKVIAQLIASLLDSFLSPVYTITTMKLGDLYKYIPITNKTYADAGAIWADDLGPTVNRVLLGTGLMIWVVLSIFAILIDFYYVASGDKRAVPGSKLFLKIVVTGVLTWKSQELMFYIFDNIIQPLTSSFQDAVKGADSTPNVFSVIGSSFCTISAGLVGAVIAILMLLLIGINYFKLALEMIQRYLIIAVICALSPMAFATGSNSETEDISKKWFRMFWSQCVLLFLNVWCLAVVKQGMMNVAQASADKIVIWGLVVYGFIKVSQQLDDILQNAGLSITRQTSGMLEDFFMMGKSMMGLASTAVNAAATGFQFKQDSAKLREGLANGTKTMDDYKRHIANTTANNSRNPFALAMLSGTMAREYAAAKMTDKDYKQSVSDYMKMKSPDRQKAPAPNLNSQTGRNQVKSALESSNNKKIANAAKNGEVTNAYTDANGVIHASLQTKDKNGRVNGMYDVAVSGNGKDVMAQVASSREVTTDANGNKLIKDDKLGTFAYNKETGTFEQVKDKDGNVPENPLSVQVPDKVNKNNVEEVADWATKTDGFDKAVQEKEATDNYFNATAAERLNMDSSDVNQDQMNNMARHEINGTFEREGANGEKQLAIGEDDKLDVAVNKDTGEMTAKHSMLNDDGTVSVQNYKKDADGNWQAVGESEYYTAMGDKPSYRNDKGEVFVGTQVGTSNDGNAIMRYDQIGKDGKVLENGKSFNVTQSASLANSDDAASKVEMARQASESLGAKAVLWYVEDEGIIEKPESLKTAAEIKQEEKDAKKAAKLEKKKQKEYLSTLGPKERKIAKARFKAQALEKAERDRKRREEELRIYNEAIAKREKEEAEKAKEEQTLSQLEKDKESNKKLSARQAVAQRRAEIKKLRRENTLREKEEAKAAKKKAKEDALAKKQAEKEAKKKTSPKKKQVTQNKAGVAAAPSVQQKEQPKKPLLINLDKVSKKEKQQATQQTAAPAVQEQKPQKSQKSAIDNILKKEAKKKEEPIKEEKQAESKAEVTKPEKREPAIVPVVKASSVQEQATEKPTHQPVKAPQKEEVTVTDSKKADVREVPDLLDSHNVFYGIGANQGNEFVLDDDEKGGNSL